MPRIRKDTCPNCKTINPDGWDICWQCKKPAPGAVACPNRGGSHPYMLTLNRAEAKHLLHCLKLAVIYNDADRMDKPDVFWSRHKGLNRKVKAIIQAH